MLVVYAVSKNPFALNCGGPSFIDIDKLSFMAGCYKCWQMTSTFLVMHLCPGPISSIDFPHLLNFTSPLSSSQVILSLSFSLLASPLSLSWPIWCYSLWPHVLPTVFAYGSLSLLFLLPLFLIFSLCRESYAFLPCLEVIFRYFFELL